MSLHIKYRPSSFDEVIGQDNVVKAIKAQLKSTSVPHAYLLVGSSGVGKTTLGHIIAKELNCSSQGLIQVSCPNEGDIESIRDLVSSVNQPRLGSPTTVIIMDEFQALSGKCFQVFLTALEEACPKNVFWVFATTDASKIPQALIDRCQRYNLRKVPDALIRDYLEVIAELEYPGVWADYLDLATIHAEGSVRKALTSLATIANAESLDAALELLQKNEVEETGSLGAIMQLMLSSDNKKWEAYFPLLQALEDEHLSGAKQVLLAYVTQALSSTKNVVRAREFAIILDAVDQMPTNPELRERKPSLLMCIWRVILS